VMRIGKKFGGALAVACHVMIVCSVVLPVSALAADGPDSSAAAAKDNKGAAATQAKGADSTQAAQAASDQHSRETNAVETNAGQSFAILMGLEKLKQDLGSSSSAKAEVPSSTRTPAPSLIVASTATAPEPGQEQSTQQTGQSPQNTQQTQQSAITQPLAASPEVGPERVGVDLNQVENLPLQDAIATALRNNLGIENFRQSVRIAQYNLFAYRGVYDVTSTANINFGDSTVPAANQFSGAVNGAISSKSLTDNFTTSQLLQPTGGSWTVAFNNNRLSSSNVANTLNPLFTSSLQVTFVQPLMRNLSVDANRRQIQVLKRQLDVSDSQFRQEVIQIINQVQDAYWNLVFARRNEKIARDTVELTRTQLQNDRKQVEAGTAAPIDLRSDEAALEARKGDVINALQQVTTAENVVKGLLLKDPTDKTWNSVIVPTDEPDFGQPTLNVDEALRIAMKNRPELDQLRLQSEINDTNIKFYKNQLKPQVDFVGIYGIQGLAGTTTLEQATGLKSLDQLVLDKLNK
ncbi:MAG: TolC family protein, partial [Blastocatellia bacterium]